MDDILTLLLVACLCHVISTQSDVRLPPRITKGPREKNSLYKRGASLKLECNAEGTPAVRYEWKKNGFQLNTNLSRVRKESNGTIAINRATNMDEGYYQCFAENQYGTALSDMIHVRMAFLNFTAEPSNVHRKTVVEGMPFHIQADRDRSFPKPQFDWDKAFDIDSIFTPLWTSRRIQFAENGDLHFAYALPEDGGRIVSCSIENTYLERQRRGCYTQLTVTRNSTGNTQFAPTLAFSSETQTVALIGERVTLRCFFYGRPEPTITWPRHLPTGRYSLGIYNIELTINNITASDEADYICTASNTQGRREHTLQIRVEAKPEFNNTMDGPHNVNVTEGESVTFNCNPFAKPQAKIVWLQNGQPIDIDNPPERFVFSNDKKSLTIRDVCRDCVDRESKTDLMVIQCNASNIHGYAFAQGYLNVLMNTKVTIGDSKSESASVDFLEEKKFIFKCYATSDPSTPPTVRWYKTEPFGDLVRDEPPYIYLENRILMIMIDPNCSSKCAKYLGEYRCVGDNGFSRDNRTIRLSYQYRPSPDEHTTKTFVQKEETWALWKTLLCAGAFGLLLFLIGIFIGSRSKRRFVV